MTRFRASLKFSLCLRTTISQKPTDRVLINQNQLESSTNTNERNDNNKHGQSSHTIQHRQLACRAPTSKSSRWCNDLAKIDWQRSNDPKAKLEILRLLTNTDNEHQQSNRRTIQHRFSPPLALQRQNLFDGATISQKPMERALITRNTYIRHRRRSEFNATKAPLLPFEPRSSSDFVISICVKVRSGETENERETKKHQARVCENAPYSYSTSSCTVHGH